MNKSTTSKTNSSKGHPDAVLTDNLKMFFGKYRHSITLLTYKSSKTSFKIHDYDSIKHLLGKEKTLKKKKQVIASNVLGRKSLTTRDILIITSDKVEQLKEKFNIRTRENFWDFTIFFNDIEVHDSFVNDPNLAQCIKEIRMMPESVGNTYDIGNKLKEFKTTISVVQKLPDQKYRYRLHLKDRNTFYSHDGRDAGEAMAALINSSDGIKVPQYFADFDEFMKRIDDRQVKGSNGLYGQYYFKFFWNGYPRTILTTEVDWLQVANLIDPDFVKRIEKLVLDGEIDNEDSDQNTN